MAPTTGAAMAYPPEVLHAQATFRAAMEALARPGRLQSIALAAEAATAAPAPMTRGAAVLARALFDSDTPIWLDGAMAANCEVADWLRFQTGAAIVASPANAAFALIAEPDAMPPFERFALGSSDYPDRSTTLIIQVASLADGPALSLRGPGIDGIASLTARLPADLPARLAANRGLFPRGVDLMLVADDSLVGLPRTTRVTAKED